MITKWLGFVQDDILTSINACTKPVIQNPTQRGIIKMKKLKFGIIIILLNDDPIKTIATDLTSTLLQGI
jgi:hypothetical protein